MFKKYGVIGILMILLGEFLIFYRVEPFTSYLFFQLFWLGYILTMDALVYHRTNKSLLINKPKRFISLFFISIIFWWIFELLNISIRNWSYENVAEPQWLMFSIAFSFVLPAILETRDFLMSTRLFKNVKMKKGLKISNVLLISIIFIGLLVVILPWIYPNSAFPLVWIALLLLLDPINYYAKKDSILGWLEKKKLRVVLVLMFAGLFCGFFWEFWNYWAPVKWYYNVPYVGFLKIFEMPILGYIGYLFFALEIFVMYNFVLLIFDKIKSISLKCP